MKSKSIGSLILLAALSPCCGGGGAGGSLIIARWANLYRLPTTMNLRVVACDTSGQQVLVAGEASTLLSSVDGGLSWTQLEDTPADRGGDILAMSAASNTVTAVGVAASTGGSAAWDTTDSVTWTNSENPRFPEPWVAVSQVVPTTTTTPGSSYRLRPNGKVDLYENGFFSTVDSRDHIVTVPVSPQDPAWTSANGMIFFGISGNGLVCGSDNIGNGRVRRTIDNGAGWDTMAILDAVALTPITVPPLRRFFMGSFTQGIVVGDTGTILLKTPGFDHWVPMLFNAGSISANLRGISFPVDFNTGWVVGLGGAIFKLTFNTGTLKWDFVNQNPGAAITNKDLYDVVFSDNMTGYAVGDGGTLLKTINGGTTWVEISGPAAPLPQFNAVDFSVDGRAGLVVGNGAVIKRTLNNGMSWGSFNQGGVVTGNLAGASIPRMGSGNVAYVCGDRVWKQTTLEGALTSTWTLQSSAAAATYRAILFPGDDQKGVVVGNSSIVLRTTDGGTTWGAPTGTAPPGSTNYAALCASPNGNLVFAAGNNGANGVLASSDISGSTGADSWTTRPGLTGVTINAIQAPLGTTTSVYAAGQDGKVYRLNGALAAWDGGVVVAGASTAVVSLAFIDEMNGWAVVQDTVALGKIGGVFTTINGGTTWTRSYLHVKVSDTLKLRAIWMNAGLFGVTVGDNGWIFGTVSGGN